MHAIRVPFWPYKDRKLEGKAGRRAIVALLTALFLVGSASPALAYEKASNCVVNSYNGGQYNQKVCAIVNEHSTLFWREALVRFRDPVGPNDGAQFYIDYLRLYRDGVKVEWTNNDAWYVNAFVIDKSTDWDKFCNGNSHTWQTEVRYRHQWPNGAIGAFHVLWSDEYTTAVC